MLIQINTDRNVEGREELAGRVEAKIRRALDRFSEKLTRVEVHLGDENSDKKAGNADKRCLLEGRPASMSPVAVDHLAPTTDLAVDGALEKLERALDSELGKRRPR